jgi:chitodextrinase
VAASPGPVTYRIYRGGNPVATTAATAYVDGGRTPNTSYTYTVTAYDGAGNESAPSAPAAAMTLP